MPEKKIGDDKGYSVELTINGDNIFYEEFEEFDIFEEWNNVIPIFRAKLSLSNKRLAKILKINSVVKFKLKYYNHLSGEYEFLLQKFNYKKGNKNFYSVEISGLLNVQNYYESRKQKLFDEAKSSVEIMGMIAGESGLTPKLVLDKSDDKEFWIQYNNTNKNFVDYLYSFSYKSDDLVLIALDKEKNFIISSINKILKLPKIKVGNKEEKMDLKWEDYEFNLNFNEANYKLSPKREVQIYNVIGNIFKKKQISENSIMNKKKYIDVKDYNPFSTVTDNGWTNPNYKFSKKFNLVKRNQLKNYSIKMRMQTKQNLNKLKLLEKVSFFEFFEGTDGQDTNPAIEGDYIIGKIHLKFSRTEFELAEYTIYRDFYNV